MSGTITNIFIKSAVGGAMQPVNLAQALANKGLEGDANIGKRRRQVLLIEHETITEWGLAPGTVRENVTVRNLALAGNAKVRACKWARRLGSYRGLRTM